VSLVSIVALTILKTRSPFLYSGDNYVAEVMMWQTIVTLLLCVLVKSTAEGDEGGGVSEGAVDRMMVCAQFLWVVILAYKRLKGAHGKRDEYKVAVAEVEEGQHGIAEKQYYRSPGK